MNFPIIEYSKRTILSLPQDFSFSWFEILPLAVKVGTSNIISNSPEAKIKN